MSSWIDPTFICGECGGVVARFPVTNLLSQKIWDWRHVNAPPGTAEHRAVLGTPAHQPRVPEIHQDVVEEGAAPEPAPPPEMPARPALYDDLPGPAQSLDRLAAANGWEVQAWIMRGTLMDVRWKPLRVITSVVLWLDRDGQRLVATWRTKGWRGVPFREFIKWEFDSAWSLTREVTALGGNQLKAAVEYPRAICEACGESPAFHHSTKWGLVCHADHVAQTTPSTTGGTPCSSD